MVQPFISIIIVNWNAVHHLKRFLPSVVATNYPNFEIILADNASTDESVLFTKTTFPDIRVHILDQNYGYCGGNNRAAAVAKGEILLFLNNDVAVDSQWLTELAPAFNSPEIGIVQPKLRSFLNPDWFEYAGAAGGFIDALGYPFCRGRIFDNLEQDQLQYEIPGPIFWASGAAFAIRKSLFEELGGFDEDFEFHMEEIDLSWRALRNGHLVWYMPKSVVFHLGGGSLNALSPRKTFYNFRNNWWMLMKNLSADEFQRVFLKRLLLDGVAVFKELMSLRLGHAFAIIRGVYLAFTNPKKQTGTSSGASFLYKKSIIWEYFIKGKRTYHEINA